MAKGGLDNVSFHLYLLYATKIKSYHYGLGHCLFLLPDCLHIY